METYTIQDFIEEIESDGDGCEEFQFQAIKCYFENGEPTKKLDNLGPVLRIDVDERNAEFCCVIKDYRVSDNVPPLTLSEVRELLRDLPQAAADYEVVASEFAELPDGYSGRIDTKPVSGIAWNDQKAVFSLMFIIHDNDEVRA